MYSTDKTFAVSLFLLFIVGDIIQRIRDSSGYEQRKSEVSAFNATNRWKKRGLSLVPMLYGQYDYTAKFHILLSIYQGDGTISISCGAVEMGQGKTRVKYNSGAREKLENRNNRF